MKKTLITGGCHGLGRALVSSLIKKDYHVTILDCDENTLNELSQSYPTKIKTHCIDLTDQIALNVLISELIKTGPYKQVILNAGINATGKFEEISAIAYQNLLMVNIQSSLLISATFVKNKAIESDGSVIFISSLSHAVGYPGAAVYAASKDCIAIYAKSIRKAYATLNISVLTVFPGPIKTSHAERHAPIGADASKRMEPDVLAQKILSAAQNGKSILYPDLSSKIISIAGRIAPGIMTNIMHKIIFKKMDGAIFSEHPIVPSSDK